MKHGIIDKVFATKSTNDNKDNLNYLSRLQSK